MVVTSFQGGLILWGPGSSVGVSHAELLGGLGLCWLGGHRGIAPPGDAVCSRSVSWGTGNRPPLQEWPGSAGQELSEVWSNFYLCYTKETFLLFLLEMLTPLR